MTEKDTMQIIQYGRYKSEIYEIIVPIQNRKDGTEKSIYIFTPPDRICH